MKKLLSQKAGPRKITRREFLAKAAKEGSIAALIASGLLGAELKELLADQATQGVLSKEALEGVLPNKSLEMIRNLLKGEYYRGGRFFRGVIGGWYPKDPSCIAVIPEGSGTGIWVGHGARCGTDPCDEQICPNHSCGFNPCDDQLCGGIADRCREWSLSIRNIDTREITSFDVADFSKFSSTRFVQELMSIMKLNSTQALESEIKTMIQSRQTLQMRGYIK